MAAANQAALTAIEAAEDAVEAGGAWEKPEYAPGYRLPAADTVAADHPVPVAMRHGNRTIAEAERLVAERKAGAQIVCRIAPTNKSRPACPPNGSASVMYSPTPSRPR
jgi:hypothetical protein